MELQSFIAKENTAGKSSIQATAPPPHYSESYEQAHQHQQQQPLQQQHQQQTDDEVICRRHRCKIWIGLTLLIVGIGGGVIVFANGGFSISSIFQGGSSISSHVVCQDLVPGIEILQRGWDSSQIDLTPIEYDQSQGAKKPILKFTCNDGKTQRRNVEQYQNNQGNFIPLVDDIPDQVVSNIRTKSGSDVSEAQTFTTYRSTMDSMAVNVGLSGFFKFVSFGFSSSYKKVMKGITDEKRYYSTQSAAEYTNDVYLKEPADLALADYPRVYIEKQLSMSFESSPQLYLDFIEEYGTHYFEEGKFGGKFQVNMFTASSYVLETEQEQFSADVKACFAQQSKGSGCAGGGFSSGDSNTDSSFQKSTDITKRYFGGQESYGGVSGWKPSVVGSPTLISGKLRPIYDLISDVHTRESMKEAVEQYLMRKFYEANLVLLKNNLIVEKEIQISLKSSPLSKANFNYDRERIEGSIDKCHSGAYYSGKCCVFAMESESEVCDGKKCCDKISADGKQEYNDKYSASWEYCVQTAMDCPPGWVHDRIRSMCYKAVQKSLNFVDARAECTKLGNEGQECGMHIGAEIACPRTEGEITFLKKLAQKNNLGGLIWINLRNFHKSDDGIYFDRYTGYFDDRKIDMSIMGDTSRIDNAWGTQDCCSWNWQQKYLDDQSCNQTEKYNKHFICAVSDLQARLFPIHRVGLLTRRKRDTADSGYSEHREKRATSELSVTQKLWKHDTTFRVSDCQMNRKLLTKKLEQWIGKRRKTYNALIKLVDKYKPDPETTEDNYDQEIHDFLDSFRNNPISRWMSQNGITRDQLKNIWFTRYGNSSEGKVNKHTDGFEHVFSGEYEVRKNKKGDIIKLNVKGLHNWITFAKRWKDGMITHVGGPKIQDPPQSQSPQYLFIQHEPRVASLSFRWNSQYNKPAGSFSLGTSPEFDMAIYTYCFIKFRNKLCPVQLGPTRETDAVMITTVSAARYDQPEALLTAYVHVDKSRKECNTPYGQR